MEKCIIVAMSENRAIGKDNSLLWHISEDMKFFRRTTIGSPVIMGSKTYFSIGRPLPKRTNIVITRRDWKDAPEGVVVVDSLEKAYAAAEATGCERCFVIGGGITYKAAMSSADVLYVTRVHAEIADADTFFPEIDPAFFEKTEVSEIMEEDGWKFDFSTYRKIM